MGEADDLEDVRPRLQYTEAKLALREHQLAIAAGGWSPADLIGYAQQRYLRGEIDVDQMETEIEDALTFRVSSPPGW